MKSADRIAAELGVTAGDIRRRLSPEFTRKFSGHMEERGGALYFDAEVEELLRLLFNRGKAAPYEGIIEGAAAPPEAETAREEAALAGQPAQLPAVCWAQLPVVRAITMPLNYRPDLLVQAVEIQRRELAEFLAQFDRLVEQMVPSVGCPGKGLAAGAPPPRKPVRLVGAAAGR